MAAGEAVTVSDIDIFRSAKLLVDQHGAEAPIEAALHFDAMLEKGDLDGQRVWLRIPSTGQGVDARPGASGRFDKTAEPENLEF